MGTFKQDPANALNAKDAESQAPKDDATKEDIEQADNTVTDAATSEMTDETVEEAADRHVASTELPAEDVTAPETQAKSPVDHEDSDDDEDWEWDTAEAEEAGEKIVPGAKSGPKPDGSIRNDQGNVAYAPPGSYNAAVNGVQQDASGHVDSVGTDNSSKSGTRT